MLEVKSIPSLNSRYCAFFWRSYGPIKDESLHHLVMGAPLLAILQLQVKYEYYHRKPSTRISFDCCWSLEFFFEEEQKTQAGPQ